MKKNIREMVRHHHRSTGEHANPARVQNFGLITLITLLTTIAKMFRTIDAPTGDSYRLASTGKGGTLLITKGGEKLERVFITNPTHPLNRTHGGFGWLPKQGAEFRHTVGLESFEPTVQQSPTKPGRFSNEWNMLFLHFVMAYVPEMEQEKFLREQGMID